MKKKKILILDIKCVYLQSTICFVYRTFRSDNLWMSYQWLHVQERGDDDVGGQAVTNQADLPQSVGPVCKSTKDTFWSYGKTCLT